MRRVASDALDCSAGLVAIGVVRFSIRLPDSFWQRIRGRRPLEVEDQRHRPVVDEFDLHVRPEHSRLDVDTLGAERVDERLDQRFGPFGGAASEKLGRVPF